MSALLWGDVAETAAGDGVLVTVRRGKTNPEGEAGAKVLRRSRLPLPLCER